MTLFDMPQESRDTHPAKWSTEILERIAPIIRAWRLPVHDPFAGTGERIARLCDTLGLTFTGTEIEPEFARDARVHPGDSTMPLTYPARPYCIVTSPAYPNGMADHFKASTVTGRNTYRQALARTLGHDRPLHVNNMGRYGARYGESALRKHYAIARKCVPWWPDQVIVNVKDFKMAGEVHDVVAPWSEILTSAGYELGDPILVDTPGNRYGQNHDARVEHETVLIATRATQG